MSTCVTPARARCWDGRQGQRGGVAVVDSLCVKQVRLRLRHFPS